MLACLTGEYNPFILSFEGCGQQISSDMIKQKLLNSDYTTSNSHGNALYTSKKFKFHSKKKQLTCFNCGGKSHKAAECKKERKSNTSKNHLANTSTNPLNLPAATAKVVRSTRLHSKVMRIC